MKNLFKLSLIVSSIMFSGCALTPPPHNDIIRFSNSSDCKLAWQHAQFYIAASSTMKIQTATDTIIQTYSPQPDDYGMAPLSLTAMKMDNSTGGCSIVLSANSLVLNNKVTNDKVLLEWEQFIKSKKSL